jgi:hypothetical protein
MPVTAARARKLALSLEDASARPHFDRIAFRTPRKTFATLGPSGKELNFMFDAGLQEFFSEQAPGVIAPLPGGWGRMGATSCDLTRIDEATFMSALKAAHALAAPKPKKPRKRKSA